MSEPASAIFSIADAGEFRFARFYIVCEAVMHRNTKKSAHCLRRVGHIPRIVKTWKDTELDIKSGREEILAFCSNEYPMHCFYLELYCILHFIVTGNLFSALCASLILRLF